MHTGELGSAWNWPGSPGLHAAGPGPPWVVSSDSGPPRRTSLRGREVVRAAPALVPTGVLAPSLHPVMLPFPPSNSVGFSACSLGGSRPQHATSFQTRGLR